jgi:hypothetical protein
MIVKNGMSMSVFTICNNEDKNITCISCNFPMCALHIYDHNNFTSLLPQPSKQSLLRSPPLSQCVNLCNECHFKHLCVCGACNHSSVAIQMKCQYCNSPSHILHTVLVPNDCHLCEFASLKICCKCADITTQNIVSESLLGLTIPTDVIRVIILYCVPQIIAGFSRGHARSCNHCGQMICTKHQMQVGKTNRPNYICKDITKCLKTVSLYMIRFITYL